MRRTERLFEIIQILRSESRVVTAAELADRLEVSPRTVYRDIQALQAMRTPIEGEAGVGYVIGPEYDLPPLNFSIEEIEAIAVGLSLVAQTGDRGLCRAALQVSRKIDAGRSAMRGLRVSERNPVVPEAADPNLIRAAIRDEQKLDIAYTDEQGHATARRVRPFAVVYYVQSMLMAAWCELRSDYRHFRIDRIEACDETGVYFKGEGEALRNQWASRRGE